MSALAEHKRAEAARRTDAARTLCRELAAAACGFGGRYLLYGSAARGALRYDSDVDPLLDFPDPERMTAAWTFAEERCAALGLIADILPLPTCDERFLKHVLPEVRSLG